ncbi:MAG: hypothetical protein K2F96_02330, partial [Muribaculaceae bacterium]|nr:hypothetical protein [Muribaculaceae bacterium]
YTHTRAYQLRRRVGGWEMGISDRAQTHVACTPGVGFGSCGEGYVRLTAFNTLAATEMAMDRISKFKI